MTNGSHSANNASSNYKRRAHDNTVSVPQSVLPFLFGGFVIAASLWVKDIAAEDTDKKLKPIVDEVKEIEDNVLSNNTKIVLIETKLINIEKDVKATTKQAADNNKLLIRIANKINVETDDIE